MLKKQVGQLKALIVHTHLFNLVTARLHQFQRRRQLKKLSKCLIKKYKKEPMEQVPSDHNISNYVWVCWWQGEEHMSPIVRKCYQNIKKFNTNKIVVLITEKNLDTYVNFPEYILKKYHNGSITPTHLSDLLRTELLRKYGGVWMDITLLTWTSIPDRFYDFPIYTGRFVYNKADYNISKNRWTSFFLVARYPENILFRYLSDFWKIYWKYNNELIEYFLIDYAFDLGYCSIPAIKKELDMVPVNSCGKDVWRLLPILSQTYNPQEINDIIAENWMQKLSYKGENHIQRKSLVPENSVYQNLFLS